VDVKKNTDPLSRRAPAHIAGDAMVQSNLAKTEPFGSAPSMDDLVHVAVSDGRGVELREAAAVAGDWVPAPDDAVDPPPDWLDVHAPSEPSRTAAAARTLAVRSRLGRFIMSSKIRARLACRAPGTPEVEGHSPAEERRMRKIPHPSLLFSEGSGRCADRCRGS